MRFVENGPDIPEELLVARDEGRVVFFCGAGVSLNRVNLPDFVKLTKLTMEQLGSDEDSPAHKILGLMESSETPDGLISADKIFSILEREFFIEDIERVVSRLLTPSQNPDLTSHQAVVDLSRTSDGRTQLITTNFDRLFEDCDPTLKTIIPPLLPNLNLSSAIDGIIHLHGIVNKTYTDSEGGEGFVLSTGSYGKAYLSEAWATEFIKVIFQKYIVVFLGYSADDPPIHFLLEALNKQQGSLKNVFSFSSEDTSDRWLDRGVQTISYNDRSLLWKTIEQWALRAKSPENWFKTIAETAQKKPVNLSQFERGQIAGLVSEVNGAKVFSELSPAPVAEWLNVFDSSRRYAKPFKQKLIQEVREEVIDPFAFYSLDSDKLTEAIDLDDFYAKREVPDTAWDGFKANERELIFSQNKVFQNSFFNYYGSTFPLPQRLSYLANWFADISNQEECIEWVVNKKVPLHPEIRQRIERNITDKSITVSKAVAMAWQYIFESWENKFKSVNDQEFYRLTDRFDKFGANAQLIRQYCNLRKPLIDIFPPYSYSLGGDDESTEVKLFQLVRVDTEYYRPYTLFEIPNEFYSLYVSEMRLVLENAMSVENELSSYSLDSLPSLFAVSEGGDNSDRTRGFVALFFDYFEAYKNLLNIDFELALQEYDVWGAVPKNTPFLRLKIWACGNNNLCDKIILNRFFSQLSRSQFLDDWNQRDLLTVLSKRWNDFSEEVLAHIESMLIAGEEKTDSNCEYYEQRRTRDILNRVTWLKNNGCTFKFDYNVMVNSLKRVVPEWKEECSLNAIEDFGKTRGGWVCTDNNCSGLQGIELSEILNKARELSEKSNDFLVENDPFAGLCQEQPVKALRSLTLAAKNQDFPTRTWDKFLNANVKPVHSSDRFSFLVAERLCTYDVKFFDNNIFPLSEWFQNNCEILATHFPKTYDKFFSKLLFTFTNSKSPRITAVSRNKKQIDWVLESINSPVGKITEAIFKDPNHNKLNTSWMQKIEALLSLTSDSRHYVLVTLGSRLWWLDSNKPKWTKKNLLPVFNNGQEDDKKAIRQGFFRNHNVPEITFFKKIIPSLLDEVETNHIEDERHFETLIGFLLVGWITKEKNQRLIDKKEVRSILIKASPAFRARFLWQIWVWYKEDRDNNQWIEGTITFFKEVWPRQKNVRNLTVTDYVCEIIISRPDLFERMYGVGRDFLGKVEKSSHWMNQLDDEASLIIKNHPILLIKMLYQVLPEDSALWPYGFDSLLQTISKVVPDITLESEFIELNRILKNS